MLSFLRSMEAHGFATLEHMESMTDHSAYLARKAKLLLAD